MGIVVLFCVGNNNKMIIHFYLITFRVPKVTEQRYI